MLDVSCRPCDCIFLCARSFSDLCMWQWEDTLVSFWQPMWRPQRFGRCRFWLFCMFLFRICYNLTDLTCYDFSSCRIYSPALQIFIRAIFVKTSWFLRCGNCRERTAVLAVPKYKRRLRIGLRQNIFVEDPLSADRTTTCRTRLSFSEALAPKLESTEGLCFLHVFPGSSRNLPERQCKHPKLLRSIHQPRLLQKASHRGKAFAKRGNASDRFLFTPKNGRGTFRVEIWWNSDASWWKVQLFHIVPCRSVGRDWV